MRAGLAEILFYACLPLAFAAAFVVIVWAVQYAQRRNWSVGSSGPILLYRGPLAVALVCMLSGLALSVHYADQARQTAYANAQIQFQQQAEQVEARLNARMHAVGHLLLSVRGLFQSGVPITATTFGNYVQSNDLAREFPGLRGLGYTTRVQRAELPALLERLQRETGRAVQVKTSGNYADLMVVAYLEPAQDNAGAIGYDIGSEPVRRAAAEAALRSGEAALTRTIGLVQDGSGHPAFLYLLPLYTGLTVPDSVAERSRRLHGWAVAPLVFAEFMAAEPEQEPRLSNFQLFDSPQLGAQSLIYDSELPDGTVNRAESAERAQHSAFSVLRPIRLVDQVFYLRINSTPAFEASYHPNEHLKSAALGSGLGVLLAMVLWLLMVGRARAVDMAQNMTQDLERLAMVARGTSNAVFFTDAAWRITWVNEGFSRMSGFSAEEALGRKPSELLHSPLADPSVVPAIDEKAEAGERVSLELLLRSKAGRDYWVDLEVVPLPNEQGRVSSYLAVQSDITEEVRAKAALVVEKQRADNILSGTHVGTWESNLITGEQQWNDRWGAMMGFGREEIVPGADQFWQQRLHPADKPRMDRLMADCIAGISDGYSCEVRVLRRDGSWMWVLSRAKVMSRARDGRVEWIGGIHTDITEAKQVELSLREMEAFLDRAGRMAGVGAWQIDLKTREVVFSAQTCAIHGMAPGFKPTEEVLLSFYPEADRERLRHAMERAQSDGTPWDMVAEFQNAQGAPMWVRIVGEIGYDESGPARLVGALQDVTRDQLAQREVERSSALLRGAIEAINEAFVVYDPQDRLVFCNDKYRAIYAKSADLMVEGASFESIIRGGAERGQYAEALGRVEEWVAERMAAHRLGNVSMEQRLDDGRWLKVVERRMADGHSVGFRVDITELKSATAAAELISATRGEEQRRMQNILEGTHVGTWEWNIQTGQSIYNEQYVQMLGYTLAELEPVDYETWVRLVHPDDLVESARRIQEHLSGERPNYEIEVRMQHKQGHWIWVLAKGKLASRMEDGRPLWMYGTHMDITERKLAEQQLAQTSAMLQNVLDSATAVGVMALGLDRQIQVFNKGAENLLGYGADELLQQHSPSIFFEPTELGALGETLELMWGRAPQPAEVFEEVLKLREQQEWTLVRKDGSRFKASLIFSPMHDAQGQQVGSLAIIYDISRQKEYETSLREAMHLAEQSSVAKSQFLANMSHEIRTPMNAILGMLQLLRNTALNPNQRDYAEKAAGAARSLLGLLNDILDFSKVEAGKMQLNPEPFLLEGLLGDLAVILSSNLGNKNVDLLFDVDPAIPRELIGDAMRLKQILINLGGNAVKFTEKGQVVIRWSLLAHTPERVKIAVAVVDTGIGIAPENQARIFNAFTQAEANTTRRFGGTGLGLVISTRLIRLMGGELQLSSAVGQGSTFSFSLELGVAAFAPPGQAPALPDAAAPSVRAMLVDDNAQALATGAAMMRSLGWQVSEAASGEDALATIKASLEAQQPLPEVLFVDWHMPGMDGWDTLRNVRRLFGSRKPPLFILLSRQSREALAQRTDREQELLNGLMVKPLTAAMFAQTLAQARDGASVQAAQALTSSCRLAGMRVLLVEDNAINQQVAQELLSGEGALVTLADNGALGLAALQQANPPFDAVLMDLQMPVMDGLTATRQLRADPRFASLPVIAMTANAMRSDREECLAAGMNDHVGKPFDLNRLVQTLVQHTQWVASQMGSAPAAATAAPSPAQEWPAGLDVEGALQRMGGNRGLLQRSIDAFVADALALPQRLQHADLEAARRELHALKGLSATIGAPQLSALAATAEKLAHVPEQQTQFAQQVAQFLAALEALQPQLHAVSRQLAAGAASAPVGRSLDAAALQQLKALQAALEASDMAAMELHATLRQELDDSLSDALAPLDSAMSELEFEQAAAACEKLVQQFETP